MNILIIAAHPDDEVLGCGGTMARLAQEGHQVSVAILGEGISSRANSREAADQGALQKLRECSVRAAALLGIEDVQMFGLPDNRFDSVPLLEVVKIIENLVETRRPDEVYTQHGGDLNIDHLVTYRATLTATRPVTKQSVRAVYAYEVPSSTEWAFGSFQPSFRPNVFVDVSRTLELKIAAMHAYESESRSFPHPRAPEALRALATWRGSTAGLNAAEAFQMVREVRQ